MLDSIFSRHATHLLGNVPRVWPVVYVRKYVGMYIDHWPFDLRGNQ